MRVEQRMTRTVVTVQPHDSLRHAMALMRDRDCGSVVVIDDRAQPLAMLTDRDVGLAALRTDRPLSGIEVGEIMQRELHACRADDTIAAIEDRMALHRVRRLPVVDAGGRLVGIITLDDLARAAVREAALPAPPESVASVGETLGRICRPHPVEPAGA